MEKSKSKKNTAIIEWRGPSRPYKKRDKSFFQTVGAIVFLLVVILFFIREWLIIGVSLAIVFVVYALATVPPSVIDYKLTDKGVWIDDVFFEYANITQFWFEKHLENQVLVLFSPNRRSGRILLVVPQDKKKIIYEELQKRLVYREKPLKTIIDKMSNWLTRTIPLEDEGKSRA